MTAVHVPSGGLTTLAVTDLLMMQAMRMSSTLHAGATIPMLGFAASTARAPAATKVTAMRS
jgi:hypothetical protein